jgi:flap endonuclease-1
VKENIEIHDLSGKRIAIDAYNTIYQFLSIIRQPDGTPLSDSKGNVTSHLSGLFYRTVSLLEDNITPIFIFDGIPPILKRHTLESRMNKREEAMKEWEQAKMKGMVAEAKTYAMASTKINKTIVDESKKLLDLMGIAYMQAPSEGEAQAARMSKENLVYASASQDYDSFLFGANTVIRNLTITGKRKLPGKNIYININTERIFLDNLLTHFSINQQQLIWLGMLMGTDFNEGIKGIGPKTALKIVKDKNNINEVFDFVKEKYNIKFDYDIYEVEKVFLDSETESIDKDKFEAIIKNTKPSKEGIIKFLCDEHEFSEERIIKYADKIIEIRNHVGQKSMNDWI